METNTASHKQYAIIPLSALAVTIGGLLLLAPAASAAIVINADMTEASHVFEMGDGEAYSRLAALNPANFVYDFSQAGETVITIHWQAPEGQHFVVNAPADSDAYISPSYYGGNSFRNTGGEGIDDNNIAGVLNGLTGSADYIYNIRQLTEGGGNLILMEGFFVVTAGSTITFTSATLTTTIPAAFATDFNTAISRFALTVSSYLDTDPGAMISLQAIPEPTTYAAIFGVLALGAMVVRRRRR